MDLLLLLLALKNITLKANKINMYEINIKKKKKHKRNGAEVRGHDSRATSC